MANGSQVTRDRPPRGSLDPRLVNDIPDERTKLPREAGLVALGGIVGAVLLSLLGSVIASLVAPHRTLVSLVLSQTGLWTGLVGAVWLASRRYGTGNVWRDFGVRAKGADVGRGLIVSIVARLMGGALIVPLIRISTKFSGTDLRPLETARHNPTLLWVLVGMALVGAPFIEELFFRGLLLRSLIPALGTVGAIAMQAVVFASLHLRPSYGLGNASIFVAIGAMGAVQGWVAERYRRLGPGIVAHSFFNLVAVLFLAFR
ncbi:MAG: hypothetical protein NVSMB32_09050 [Actinomycetota bacterium]